MRQKRAGSMESTWGFDVARRGVLLLSGGFDSPVAGHLMARQGLDLIAAHFSLEPITDDAAAIKARTLCGILGIPSLYVVRVGEAFAEVAHDADRRFYFILTKRLMVRLADAIAYLEAGDRRMSYYLLKPCRTATAFISTLKKPWRVDLTEAAERLRSRGWRVSDVKVMLILEGEPELTLYESGKILVKTDDEKAAREAIDRVYSAIGPVAPLAPA